MSYLWWVFISVCEIFIIDKIYHDGFWMASPLILQFCVVYGMCKLVPRYARGSFTFSELFTLSTILSLYVNFSISNNKWTSTSIAGNVALNSLVFSPWIFLSIFLVAGWVMRCFGFTNRSHSWCFSLAIAIGFTLNYYASYANFHLLWKLLTKPVCVKVILYMASVLAFGLSFIYVV